MAKLTLVYDVRIRRQEFVDVLPGDLGLPVNRIGEALERAAASMASYGGELVPGSVRVLLDDDRGPAAGD